MSKFKLLIGGGSHKLFHLKEFSEHLSGFGVESKLVIDVDVCNGFPSKELTQWFKPYNKFNKLVTEFKPDAVFVDRQLHFGLAALKSNLPLLVHLRGDYWTELEWAKKTLYKNLKSRFVVWSRSRIATKCFEGATVILPFSDYLTNIVKHRFPNKTIKTFHQGIDHSSWYPISGMNLKHPCVGLLQSAMIWGKTKEILLLTKVMEAMPNVTFYWAGDGPYKNQVLPILEKYDNFKWLGSLQYPDQVRQFLTEIDVYALVSGYDTLGMTIVEAELMKKPVVSTRVGGTSEAMIHNKTGFLVELGDYHDWIEKLTLLINDKKIAKNMGDFGYQFAKENFSWEKICQNFIQICQNRLI